MNKPVKESRKPSISGNKIRVVAYLDPEVFATLEAKRGSRSVSAYIERTMEISFVKA